MTLPDIEATPEPAASTSVVGSHQLLPEEVLAQGLIPADDPASVSAESAAEAIAAVDVLGTSNSDLPPVDGEQAAQVQLPEAEEASAASISGATNGAEHDPNSTAALIQVWQMQMVLRTHALQSSLMRLLLNCAGVLDLAQLLFCSLP